MRKLISVVCCLAMMALAQVATAATTFHVYATANNTSPNYTTIQAAITAAAAGDTISIDDSTTYTVADGTNYIKLNKSNLTLVAKAGETPVIRHTYTGGAAAIAIQRPGCQIGSVNGGTIVIDGARVNQRGIDLQFDVASYFTTASTTTLENLVFKNAGVATNNAGYFAIRLYSSTTPLPANTLVRLRYLDFQFPAGVPVASVAPNRTSDYVGILLRSIGGGTVNIENVRSNTLTGYFLTLGDENATSAYHQTGTVNMKNCKIVFDDAAKAGDSRMGSPIAFMNMYTLPAGHTLNMDNCYIRTDATKTGTVNEAKIVPAHTSADTSLSLGAIALLDRSNNVLNITNSSIVSRGTGIDVDTTKSAITLTNSDIYVPSADDWVTAGYFINLSARSVSVANDHQCTATRCNLYGLAGSQIKAGSRAAGSVFKMVTCNDWSPANQYAANWVTDSCVIPGRNPGYGAQNGETDSPGIANADLTVYNQFIRGLNIGANRDYNFGVPVELSAFSIQ